MELNKRPEIFNIIRRRQLEYLGHVMTKQREIWIITQYWVKDVPVEEEFIGYRMDERGLV